MRNNMYFTFRSSGSGLSCIFICITADNNVVVIWHLIYCFGRIKDNTAVYNNVNNIYIYRYTRIYACY